MYNNMNNSGKIVYVPIYIGTMIARFNLEFNDFVQDPLGDIFKEGTLPKIISGYVFRYCVLSVEISERRGRSAFPWFEILDIPTSRKLNKCEPIIFFDLAYFNIRLRYLNSGSL